jgi:hypothetical protein
LNTILKLLVIASFVAAIGLLMHKANAQSLEQDNHQAITQYTQELVNECAALFDTGDTKSNHSDLCAEIMDTLDNQCRDNYFSFCFGKAWVNYQ